MKNKEFSIGNLVKPIRGDFESNGMWNHERKSFYTNNDCVKITANGLVDLESNNIEVEPIKLTKEWLILFGFIVDKHYTACLDWIVLSYITSDEVYQFEFKTTEGKWVIIDVKYVHHLQNLYFSLRGKELLK